MSKRFPPEFKRDVVTVARRRRTRSELSYATVVWIEHTYNRRRRRRGLGRLTPVEFEPAFTPPCVEAA